MPVERIRGTRLVGTYKDGTVIYIMAVYKPEGYQPRLYYTNNVEEAHVHGDGLHKVWQEVLKEFPELVVHTEPVYYKS